MTGIGRRAIRIVGATAIVGVAAWMARDYRAWRALGAGGLPANPAGWLTTTVLRLVSRDPFHVRGRCVRGGHGLIALTERTGPRPRIARYPIPHRVLGPPPAAAVLRALGELLDEFAATPGLCYRTSGWERHHQALWLTVADREIAHLHPADGSLHVVLDPADAQRAIDLGWGQLHPLAGLPRLGLPSGYTLVYPPRSAVDIASVRLLVRAATRYGAEAATTQLSVPPSA